MSTLPSLARLLPSAFAATATTAGGAARPVARPAWLLAMAGLWLALISVAAAGRVGINVANVNVTFASAGHGTTDPAGTRSVPYSTAVSATPLPDAHYHFVAWTDQNGVQVTMPYTVASNVTLTAHFAPDQAPAPLLPKAFSGPSTFYVTLAATGGGSVTPAGMSVVNGGTTVSATPVSGPGCHFVYWQDQDGQAVSWPYTVTRNVTLTAFFVPNYFQVSFAVDGHGTLSPPGPLAIPNSYCATGASITYATTTPIPDSGSYFVNWTDSAGTVVTLPYLPQRDTVLTAHFAPLVTAAVVTDGNGTASPSGSSQVVPGTTIDAVPTPNPGYYFVNWTDQCGQTVTMPYTFTRDTTLTAHFLPYLKVLVQAGTHGSVSPSGSNQVLPGTSVCARPTADSGYYFDHWQDGEENIITMPYTVQHDVVLNAIFSPLRTVQVAVVLDVNGNAPVGDFAGQVQPAGPLLVMPGDALPTLTPDTGNDGVYYFVGWKVDGAAVTLPYTPAGDTTLEAHFAPKAQVTVQVEGHGSVDFSALAAALPTWPSDGPTTADAGTSVTFYVIPRTEIDGEALPDDGYALSSWTNDHGGRDVLPTTVSTDIVFTAHFTSITQVNLLVDGDGSVNPSGLLTVENGDILNPTATGTAESTFTGWTDSDGKLVEMPYTVHYVAGVVPTLTAHFSSLSGYHVSFAADGPGAVLPSVSNTYYTLVEVTPTAYPNAGYYLTGWTNADGYPITLPYLITRDEVLTAHFAMKLSVTFTWDSERGGVSPGGTMTVIPGDAVNATAYPSEGYYFDHWEIQAGSSHFTITMPYTPTSDSVIKAVFGRLTEVRLETDDYGYIDPLGNQYLVPGTVLNVTTFANEGYFFYRWTDADGTPVTMPYTVTPFSIRLTANFSSNPVVTFVAGLHGSIDLNGPVVVPYGTAQDTLAYPDEGYYFDHWEDQDGNVVHPSTDPVTANITYMAIFTANPYVTWAASPGGIVYPVGARQYQLGAVVTPSAIPDLGYVLVNWTSSDGTVQELPIEINGSETYTANFARQFAVTVIAGPHGSLLAGTYNSDVVEGTRLSAIPLADEGYAFDTWTDQDGNVVTLPYEVHSNVTLTANFAPAVTVTFAVNDPARGSLSVSVPLLVVAGSAVTADATPNTGWYLATWRDGEGAVVTLPYTATADTTLTANFQPLVLVQFQVAGTGGTVSPAEPFYVMPGTGVTATTTPDSGYSFDHWTDADDSVVTLPDSGSFYGYGGTRYNTYYAHFTPFVHVQLQASDYGRVLFEGPSAVAVGTVFNPEVQADDNAYFVNWTDATGNVVTMPYTATADATLTANFALKTNVTFTVDSHGSVDPSGTQQVLPGASVSATATADPGYYFVNWTDQDGAVVTFPYVLPAASGDFTFTAHFLQDVLVTYANTGYGNTTPAGLYGVPPGTNVCPSPVPDPGAHFVNWTDTDGNVVTMPYTVTKNVTLAANFVQDYYLVAFTTDSHGTLSGNTSQHLAYLDSTTAVTATPAVGCHFVDWEESLGGGAVRVYSLSPTISLTRVVRSTTLVARCVPNEVEISASFSGSGFLSGAGEKDYAYGDSATYTALPTIGNCVSSLLVDGVAITPVPATGPMSYTFTSIQASHTLVVTFAPIAPALNGPSGNVYCQTPHFTWAATGADHYELWVNDQTAGTNGVVQANHLTGTSWVSTYLFTVGHTYQASLRAVTADGATSTWSVASTFSIASHLLANGVAFCDSTTDGDKLFAFDVPAGVYQVVIQTTAANYVLDLLANLPSTGSFPAGHIGDARDAAGTHANGNRTITFQPAQSGRYGILVTLPPYTSGGAFRITATYATLAQPALTQPVGTVTHVTPTYAWGAVTGADAYELYVVDLANPSVPLFDLTNLDDTTLGTTSSSYPTLPLTFGHSYRAWLKASVQVHLGAAVVTQDSGWGPATDFTVAPLGSAILLAPSGVQAARGLITGTAAAADLAATRPTFQWTRVPAAAQYDLYVIDLTTGESPVVRVPAVPGTSWTPTTPFRFGHNYRAYVRPLAAGQYGPWSAPIDFGVAPIGVPRWSPLASPVATLPTLAWAAVPSATTYELWLVDLTTGQNPVQHPTGVTGTTWTTTALSYGHRYSAWARALVGDQPGAWSTPLEFAIAPLGVPVWGVPTGTDTTTPTLAWSAVPQAERYDLYVMDLNAPLSPPLRTTTLTGTTWTSPVALSRGHTYRAWLRVLVGDQASAWSASLDVSIAPLGIATLLTPAGAQATASPTFTWTAVADTTQYELWVADFTAPQTPPLHLTTLTGTSYTPASPFSYGHNYQAWIRPVTPDNSGTWSAARSFSIAPLGVPGLTAPRGSQTSTTPIFTWTAVTNATQYDVYIADLSGRAAPLRLPNATGTTWTPSTPFVYGQHYRVWIRALAGTQAGEWSSPTDFSIAPLGVPSLTAPSGTQSSALPTFTWGAVASATSYELWVTDLTTGQSPVLHPTGATGTSYTAATALSAGHAYRVWIRAFAGSQPSDWSTPLSFTIAP